jgi:cysteine-rich repeat protein
VRRLFAVLLVAGCGDSGGVPVDAAIDVLQCDAPASCDDLNSCTQDELVGAGTCNATCMHTPIPNCCGNGVVEGTEACDDGNQADYDGCSSACLYERTLVLNGMTVLPGTEGCDLNADGSIDNAFGGSANDTARGRLSNYFTQSLGGCAIYVALFVFEGTEPTMMGAPFSFTFLSGVDPQCVGLTATQTCPRATSYFSGNEPFYVRSEGLDNSGRPLATLDGMAPAGAFATTRGALTLIFPFCEQAVGGRVPINFADLSLSGTLTADAQAPTSVTARLCGAVPATALHKFPNYSSVGGVTVLDVLVIGVNSLGIRVDPTQPDIDVDGDGLETLADTDGDGNVDLCTDGNGGQIAGTDCMLDPRIADAYSLAVDVTAVGAVLSGRQP